MKKFSLLLFIFFQTILYCQETYTFNTKGVEVKFVLLKGDSKIEEKITITNYLDEDIYIPVPEISRFYFFITSNRLCSYFGIVNSIRGEYHPEGFVKLILVKARSNYEHIAKVEGNTSQISEYYFSFDFLSSKFKKKIKKDGDFLTIKVVDYLNNNTSVFSRHLNEN